MSNRSTHALAGFAVCALALGLMEHTAQRNSLRNGLIARHDREKVLGKVLLGGLAGTVAGCLPDILEPATHPGHRAFFHSAACAGGIVYALHRWLPRVQDPELRQFILSLAVSYGSHLVLDSDTPKGLPLI